MTEVTYTHYQVTWAGSSGIGSSDFWLRESEDVKEHLGSLLNLADLDASENGYGYSVKILEKFNCRITGVEISLCNGEVPLTF